MSKLLPLALGGFAAASALALTLPIAEAQPQPAQGNVCFRLNSISGSTLADASTLYIRADGGRVFRIGFANPCNTASSYTLILHPVSNNGVVCSAIGLDIAVRDTRERCVPSTLERLTPEEAAALPAKVRP